jgi:hypothetical protein
MSVTICKTVYPGSIPGVASNKIKHLEVSKSADWQNWHRIGTGIFESSPGVLARIPHP